MHLDLKTQSQVWLGLFERELYPWVRRLSRGIRTLVDVGAAHGEYALYGLTKTSADRVLAFEPDPAMCANLEKNLASNPIDRARLKFYQAYLAGTDVNAVPAECLAALVAPPCLVKMDIDGGETEVLRNAGPLLALPDLRWIIETHSIELERECLTILSTHGFHTKIVPNAWWRRVVPEQRVSPHNRWLVAANNERLLQ